VAGSTRIPPCRVATSALRRDSVSLRRDEEEW
jgi:hypothetical protein